MLPSRPARKNKFRAASQRASRRALALITVVGRLLAFEACCLAAQASPEASSARIDLRAFRIPRFNTHDHSLNVQLGGTSGDLQLNSPNDTSFFRNKGVADGCDPSDVHFASPFGHDFLLQLRGGGPDTPIVSIAGSLSQAAFTPGAGVWDWLEDNPQLLNMEAAFLETNCHDSHASAVRSSSSSEHDRIYHQGDNHPQSCSDHPTLEAIEEIMEGSHREHLFDVNEEEDPWGYNDAHDGHADQLHAVHGKAYAEGPSTFAEERAAMQFRWGHLGSEAERAAARSRVTSHTKWEESSHTFCCLQASGGVLPCVPILLPAAENNWSPPEALERRRQMLEQFRTKRRQDRLASRLVRRHQAQIGLRPHRPHAGNIVTIGSANINAASSLLEAYPATPALHKLQFCCIQEHKTAGSHREAFERDLRGLGMDSALDDAYGKHTGLGGGTGVLARTGSGVIRLPIHHLTGHEYSGRITAAYSDLFGGIAIISVYGLSGFPWPKQVALWTVVAKVVMGIGLPFIIGGDFQVTPEDMLTSRLPVALGAEVCAPTTPTNIVSKRVIDFFLVSLSLKPFIESIVVDVGAIFSPHILTVLRIRAPRAAGLCRRIVQPRIFQSKPLEGPLPPSPNVEWEAWTSNLTSVGEQESVSTQDPMRWQNERDQIQEFSLQWYAGAEIELAGAFGVLHTEQETAYMGLGEQHLEHWVRVDSRFHGAADETGIIGQRLAWSAKAIKLILTHAPTVVTWRVMVGGRVLPPVQAIFDAARVHGNAPREWRKAVALLHPVGRRAAALKAELKNLRVDDDTEPCKVLLARSLDLIASLCRPSRGSPPLLSKWASGRYTVDPSLFQNHLEQVIDMVVKLAMARRRKAMSRIRVWARSATLKTAHAVTKQCKFVAAYSASPDKSHPGELTAQAAADRGADAWAPFWRAEDSDFNVGTMQLVKALESAGIQHSRFVPDDGPFPELDIESLSGEHLLRASRTYRWDTAVGGDWLRVRHISLLSPQARDALAALFRLLLQRRTFPLNLRCITAVALGKKSGGARLIGVGASLYRIWARTTYFLVREELERRLDYPFLAAAPGRGAERSAATISLFAEQAVSRGDVAAASLVDLSKYYEQIGFDEIAESALVFGIPPAVVALILAVYSGPRRIRVGAAYSRELFPRRSAVAGCTWVTVIIRCIAVAPGLRFIAMLKARAVTWSLQFRFSIYIDDIIVAIAGTHANVALIHPWASECLVLWVKTVLGKELAPDKMFCLASTAPLRKVLGVLLSKSGFRVANVGELLGVDFAAGGSLVRRPVLQKRISVNALRRSKLKWWRGLGGNASAVARAGPGKSLDYGDAAVGLHPRALRLIRRMQGAASKINAAGASLTVKLALGGSNYADIDAAVWTASGGPIKYILHLLWDYPWEREEFANMWRRMLPMALRLKTDRFWAQVKGPFSAAWAHVHRVNCEWLSPFVIEIGDFKVDIIATPPALTLQLIAGRARWSLDMALLKRLCIDLDLDMEAVMAQYRHGIDWAMVRRTLMNKSRVLLPIEVRAYELLLTGALWCEDRKWRAGLLPSSTCLACFCECGTLEHKAHSCIGVSQHLLFQKLAGRIGNEPSFIRQAGFAPLLLRGLPPLRQPPRPCRNATTEGALHTSRDDLVERTFPGCYYGDGSGVLQRNPGWSQASWALYRPTGFAASRRRACDSRPFPTEYKRAIVKGLQPTVPRAELTAALEFHLVAPQGSSYFGDCKMVIDGLQAGVPRSLAAATSRHADLWAGIRRAIQRRDRQFSYHKIAAHKSRSSAEALGDGAVQQWLGNDASDFLAKEIAWAAIDSNAVLADEALQAAMEAAVRRVAMGIGWSLSVWPSFGRKAVQAGKPPPRCKSSDGDHRFVPRVGGGANV